LGDSSRCHSAGDEVRVNFCLTPKSGHIGHIGKIGNNANIKIAAKPLKQSNGIKRAKFELSQTEPGILLLIYAACRTYPFAMASS
jgi:hypothetical protein